MGDREFRLTELASLERTEADRAWAEAQEKYADRIKEYFKNIKSVISIDTDRGLKETFKWAQQKVHQRIDHAKKKKDEKLLHLSDYLLDNARFVHELALVDLFRGNTDARESAWAEIFEKISTSLRDFIKKNNKNPFSETESFFLKTVARAKKNLLDGKFEPEKGELKNHFINIAKDVLRERSHLHLGVVEAKLGKDENSAMEWPVDPPDIPSGMIAQELLRVTLEFGGKPHAIIAFGFTQLLDVKTEYFVRDYSDDILSELGSIFCEDYYDFWIPYLDFASYHKKCCDKFFHKLEDTIGKEYKPTTRYFKNLIPLSHMKVGAVSMRPFYGNNPASSVSDWCYKVKTAITDRYNLDQEGNLQVKTGDEKSR